MRLELIAYIGMLSIAVIFSLWPNKIRNRFIFFSIWFCIYSFLVFVVRSNLEADLVTYAGRMENLSFYFYYLREPVVWIGQPILYLFFNDAVAVFIIYDALIGLVVFLAFTQFRLPNYAFFSFFTFFPVILGMQNIYRQWVASALLLLFLSLVYRNQEKLKPLIIFCISALTHNVAAIFLPLLLLNRSFIEYKVRWFLLILTSIIGIIFGSTTKSSASTGANLEFFYLMLFYLFIFILIFLNRGFFRIRSSFYFRFYLMGILISSVGVITLSSASSERVSLSLLILSFPLLVKLIESRLQQKFFFRIIFSILCFLPILFFDVRKFIL